MHCPSLAVQATGLNGTGVPAPHRGCERTQARSLQAKRISSLT
jgi:hypothetical protein